MPQVLEDKDKLKNVDEAPSEAPSDEALARFQAALLDLLSQPLSASEIALRLREDAACAPFQDYVSGFEPRMIEVAAELTKKWGRSADGQG